MAQLNSEQFAQLQARFLKHLLHTHIGQPEADNEQKRPKLKIDQVAEVARLKLELAQKKLRRKIQHQFVNHFERHFQQMLAQPEHLERNTPFQAEQFVLLDLLLQESVDRQRVLGLMADMGWLRDGLLRYANNPNQQKIRRDKPFTDHRLVFNYLGMEAVQGVLPWLIFQRWGEGLATHLSFTQRKVWRYAWHYSETAATLARRNDLSEDTARIFALLQCLEVVLLLQTASREFEGVKQSWMNEARKENNVEVHEALRQLVLPYEPIVNRLIDGTSWAQGMLEYWGLTDLSLYKRLCTFYQPNADQEILSVQHAKLIAMVDTLKERRLLSDDELII